MNHILYIVTTTIHILAATVWVGSLVFMSLILVPALRSMKDPALMSRMIRGVGGRYRWVGWISLATLLVTGYFNLHFRGITLAMLSGPDFWQSAFGETMAWKLILFAIVVLISITHDTLAGPRLRTAHANGAEKTVAMYRRVATWLGRITLMLSLIIVVLAVMLVRGRPW